MSVHKYHRLVEIANSFAQADGFYMTATWMFVRLISKRAFTLNIRSCFASSSKVYEPLEINYFSFVFRLYVCR